MSTTCTHLECRDCFECKYEGLHKDDCGWFEVFPAAAYQITEQTNGWYWWQADPGCLPSGDPNGPFEDAREAFLDARIDQ